MINIFNPSFLRNILLPVIALAQLSGTVSAIPLLESVKYTPDGMYQPFQIEVDGQNRKWVRSSGGVHMYDGSTWSRFVSGNDLPGFARDMHVDSRGDVWLATNGGIVKWNGAGWDVIDTEGSGIEPYQLQQIYVTDDGIVWVCTTNLLFRYDGAEWKRFYHSRSSQSSYTEMLMIPGDEGDTLWLMNTHGSVSSSKSWTDSSVVMVHVKTFSNLLQETADGDVLISEGANLYLNGPATLYSRNPEGDTVHAVVQDDQGYTWYFSRAITAVKGDYWATLEPSESIIPDDTYHNTYYDDAVIDHDGVIWALASTGVMSFSPRFVVLTTPPSINTREYPYYQGDQAWISGDDLLFEWFAEDAALLTLSCSINGTDWTIIADEIDPYSFNYTWRIPDEIIPLGAYTASLGITLSTADGLADTTGIIVERRGYREGFTEYPISMQYCIDACQTPDGDLWFLARSGVYMYDGFMWTVFGITGEKIAYTPDGCVWVQTEQDIMRYNGSEWEHLFDDGKSGHRMAATPDGEVWVFCEEYLLNEGSWYHHYCRLYRFHEGEWTDEWERLGMDRLYVEDMIASADGNIVLLGNTRGYEYPLDTNFLYSSADDEWGRFEMQLPLMLFWDNQGNMWKISSEAPYNTETLFRYHDGGWTAYPIDIDLGEDYGSLRLDFVTEDTAHRFWFNSEYGILIFNGVSWSRFILSEPTRFYDLAFIDRDNNKWLTDNYRIIGFDDAGVGVESTSQPESFALGQPYPNPFNPAATIPFHLQEPGVVEIAIYSIDGRLVRELRSGWMAAGEHELRWDSSDDRGEPVSSGVYLCRLRAGNRTAVRRMTLVR